MGNVARRSPVNGVSRWRNRNDHIGVAPGSGNKSTAAVPRHREDPATAARRAGDRGHSAGPMDVRRRTLAYQAQNGSGKLTPAQRRRINKKLVQQLRREAVLG